MYKTQNKHLPRLTSGFTKKRTKGRKKTIEVNKEFSHNLKVFREIEAAKRQSERQEPPKVDPGFDPKSLPRFDIG